MDPEVLVVVCQACGYLPLRVATPMQAAAVAVEHNGGRWDPDCILISPVGRPSQ
jgi:hypothetical protein